jgi:hypothetical protein
VERPGSVGRSGSNLTCANWGAPLCPFVPATTDAQPRSRSLMHPVQGVTFHGHSRSDGI